MPKIVSTMAAVNALRVTAGKHALQEPIDEHLHGVEANKRRTMDIQKTKCASGRWTFLEYVGLFR